MRIDKFLSDCKVATRKEVAQAAKRGGVVVDGVAVKDCSLHIDPEKQVVSYMGKTVNYRKYIYVMLNKPEGYVSATEDSKLPVVTELLSEELQKTEPFPVGRLDRDTVGLMILTNNGTLAHALLSPKRHVTKEYRFKCAEPLPSDAARRFLQGVTLADGYECKSAQLLPDEDGMGGVITLTEGKYHQIKRMIASLGNRVTFLERISFGGIPLDSSLARGEYRELSESEVAFLSSQVPESLRG